MTEPDTPLNQTDPRWVRVSQKVLGVCYILAGAPMLFVLPGVIKSIRGGLDWGDPTIVFLAVVVLIAMPMAMVAGIGVARGTKWGYDLGRLTPFVPFLGALIGFFQRPLLSMAIFSAVCLGFGALVAGFLSIPPMQRSFKDGVADSPAETIGGLGRHLLMLFLGLVVIGLTLSELPQIVDSLRMARWKSQCAETGEPDSCGPYARRLLHRGTTPGEWQRGFELKRELCERGNSVACRRSAYLMSYVDTQSEDWSDDLFADVGRVALEACANKDSRGCFVARMNADNISTTSDDERDPLLEASQTLCDEGDIWACRVVFSYAFQTNRMKPDELDLSLLTDLCDQGFEVGCPEQKQKKNRGACLEGHVENCELARYDIPKHPHRATLIQIYESLAATQKRTFDIGLWAVEPIEHDGLVEACEDDVPEACLALGLKVGEGRRGDLEPELDRLADYDRTFLRACKLGLNLGCLAYAERLLNRPLGEKRRTDRADEALDIACENGEERACWLRALDHTPERTDPEIYEAALIRACKAQTSEGFPRAPCRELAYYWANEIGATPWLFSERLSFAQVKAHCEGPRGKWSCAQMAWMRKAPVESVLETSVPPWHVQNFSAAMKSCKKRNEWSCGQMFRIARDYPVMHDETLAQLKENVCEALPEIDLCASRH